MALQLYMAINSTEFYNLTQMPSHPAWMACHFSGCSSGLSNLPATFPQGSILMLDDSIPIQGHDPQRILDELLGLHERIKPAAFLLDLQRPGSLGAAEMARFLSQALPCPVAVSHLYAAGLDCPVFLPPPPLHKRLQEYLKPWNGREIWLEVAPDCQRMTVTREGCQITPEYATDLPEPVFYNEELFCWYHTQVQEDRAVFTLQRGQKEWDSLLLQAEMLGVTCCIGLYQSPQLP